jgi:AraC-like DNA-binding protein
MFIVKLETDYSLSPVEAWTLTDDLQDFIHTNATSVLQEGELYFTAVVANEPAGKPLMKCQTKQIKLCVYPTEKELIELSFSDLKRYHFIMVSRLCWQAIHQGCCLSQEDLARLLHCSVSTIRRILKQYRELGQLLPTRGNYCDIGPGISHKTETIKHYLKGETVSEISLRLAHHSQSIERYIDDFCLVVSGYATDNLSVIRLSRSLKMSEKLVTEYIDLYEQVKTDPDYQLRLQQILTRIDELFNRTKKNNRRRP